jgi:hypothetical protein
MDQDGFVITGDDIRKIAIRLAIRNNLHCHLDMVNEIAIKHGFSCFMHWPPELSLGAADAISL